MAFEGTDLVEFTGLASALGRLTTALKITEESLAAANKRIDELEGKLAETTSKSEPQEVL